MIDPDLKNELDEINRNLAELRKNSHVSVWRAFFIGAISAFGYFVGIALVAVVIGWILQRTGLLPKFKEQIKTFNTLINEAKRLSEPQDDSKTNYNYQQNGGVTTVTLPDGRQVQVNIQQ